ncbi:hypothetical protein Tco_1107792 [Tanacetum coccineum]
MTPHQYPSGEKCCVEVKYLDEQVFKVMAYVGILVLKVTVATIAGLTCMVEVRSICFSLVDKRVMGRVVKLSTGNVCLEAAVGTD